MGGLLSTTIYAVASVTAVAPPVDSATAEATPGVVSPAVTDYVIVDIPAFNRPSTALPPVISRSPSEPIEPLEFDLAQASRPSHAARSEPVSAEIGSAPPDIGFQDAVVAAHDDRITLLRQQLELATLKDEVGAAALARDLRLRLRRAEAARNLAVARARAAEVCDAACATAAKSRDEQAEAASNRTIDPPIRSRASIADMADPPPVEATALRTVAERAPGVVVRRAAAERSRANVAAVAPGGVAAIQPGPPSISRVDPDKLAFARQRLATARRVLEEGSDLPPLMAGAAVIQTAGFGDEGAGDPMQESRRNPRMIAVTSPFGSFDPQLFWAFAAGKFGLAIASLLLLMVMGQVLRPNRPANC